MTTETKVSEPAKLSPTEEVLRDMLLENTGRHFLDSGIAYGRGWERNQNRQYDPNGPVGTALFRTSRHGVEIDVTVDVFAFLAEAVEYDPILDSKFKAFATEHADESWPKVCEKFCRENGRQYDGSENSYNGECVISQTIQFFQGRDDDGVFYLLQIHNGCDVRSGYTTPRAFRPRDEAVSIHDYGCYSLLCDGYHNHQRELFNENAGYGECVRHYWSSRGGSRLESDEVDLTEVPWTDDVNKKGHGEVYIDENGVAHCPVDGSPLRVGF